ncbi:Acetyl-coenzyme A transporter 1, partial [Pseudolycoriella hygida]
EYIRLIDNDALAMQSSNGGVVNLSYTQSLTDLNVKADNSVTLPSSSSLVVIDLTDGKNYDKERKLSDPHEESDTFISGCTAAYQRFLSDWNSILILLFLYTLQGLPLGLIISIPLIIQEKSATYNQQARFSLAAWPFSLKLLWAPLVDALYIKKIGRRKSWLIPIQYLIGVTLFMLSYQVDHLIDTLQVGMLTAYFFLLNFLTATQDMAVDGWALTMLKRENVGLASTCNSVGQSIGIFIGHAVFLNLASKDFSNKYLRSEPQSEGVVTLSTFMVIWSVIYFITTTLLFVFKYEGNRNSADDKNTIMQSYYRLYEVSKLPAVRIWFLFQLSKGISIAALHVSDLKLVEAGLPKETKAILSVPLIPISLLLPIFVLKWTAGRTPMGLYSKAFVGIQIVSGLIGIMVWVTGEVKDVNGGFPSWYLPLLLVVECAYKLFTTTITVSNMAFSAKISDPEHGATFMTLYNTLSNLGSMWPTALALWLVDPLTVTQPCISDPDNLCDKPTTKIFDGYYTETILCMMILLLCCSLLLVCNLHVSVGSECITGTLTAHPSSCEKFLMCSGETFEEMSCPSGTVFNVDANTCDWPRNVKQCTSGKSITTPEPNAECNSSSGLNSPTNLTGILMQWLEEQQWKCEKSIQLLKEQLSEAEKSIQLLKEQIESGKSIQLLKEQSLGGSVPIGFTYVQLSGQRDPNVLWPAFKWEDITTNYAGLFFRAEGNDTVKFNEGEQAENSPRLTNVDSLVYKPTVEKHLVIKSQINLGGFSTPFLLAGDVAAHTTYSYHLRFNHSGGEVRPRNQAIRIWTRIE